LILGREILGIEVVSPKGAVALATAGGGDAGVRLRIFSTVKSARAPTICLVEEDADD
jgi:hypothetical protein